MFPRVGQHVYQEAGVFDPVLVYASCVTAIIINTNFDGKFYRLGNISAKRNRSMSMRTKLYALESFNKLSC